jgi:RNA polymerase sigma-70 factor (ECF subfamily)
MKEIMILGAGYTGMAATIGLAGRVKGRDDVHLNRPYEGVEIADMAAEVVDINGGPGIVMSGGGRVIATLTVDLDADGRIVTVHNVANPDKLHAVADGVRRI